MKALLEVSSLQKKFGNKQVLAGMDFSLNEGDILGFLGPNGAGKSTTIRIIMGIDSLEDGSIFYQGDNVNKIRQQFNKELGVVPQDISYYSDLTAYENVKFFASLYGLKGAELKQSVDEAIKRVGLEDYAKQYPASFSGGMKRRLNIACSIVHHPKLLIMDEPTVGIDPQSRNHIMNTIRKLHAEGTSIIYVSHYMEEIDCLCNRVVLADQGEVKLELPLDELKKTYEGKSLEEIFLMITGTKLRDGEA